MQGASELVEASFVVGAKQMFLSESVGRLRFAGWSAVLDTDGAISYFGVEDDGVGEN